MSQKEWIEQFIKETSDKWTKTSDFLWEHPELRFEEYESVKHLIAVLRDEGFIVEENIANIETAFVAEYGSGSPVIAFLGEYDALADMSQKSSVTKQEPLEKGANGHGCGHHLLGTGSLTAAVALKSYLIEHELEGTVRYYGCPAEEGGSGKTFMAREGAFDGVDIAFTWHPMTFTGVWSFSTLANIQAKFTFKGKSAHAAQAPHLGRSALDAVELMNVGVNYMREHMIEEARVHYAVTNTGGTSPNVVQSHAEVIQLIRAPEIDQVKALFERVKKIAEGAALMTETEVEVTFDKACSNYVPNHTLNKVLAEAMEEVGPMSFTEEEMGFAKEMQGTLSKEELASANMGIPALDAVLQKPLSDVVVPYFKTDIVLSGSTDVGDVSWVAPTAQLFSTTAAVGSALHSWQFVAQGKISYAHKGMLQAAKYMALAAIKALHDEEMIEKAKEELREKLSGKQYECPIPADVQPNQ